MEIVPRFPGQRVTVSLWIRISLGSRMVMVSVTTQRLASLVQIVYGPGVSLGYDEISDSVDSERYIENIQMPYLITRISRPGKRGPKIQPHFGNIVKLDLFLKHHFDPILARVYSQ